MHYRCYDIENKKYQIPYSYRPSRTVWNDSAVEWNSVPDGNVVAFKTHLLQRGGGGIEIWNRLPCTSSHGNKIDSRTHPFSYKQVPSANGNYNKIQGDSLARGPKLLSVYTVEQRGFLVRKYWQTGSFKACQMALRTEFGERRAPLKCCIRKLVKKLETRGSRSNGCRLLSLWGLLKGKVYKNTPQHNRTTQRRSTPRDSSRQRRLFGKSITEFGKTHSSVLGCERRPVSASIMSSSCFASFPVCVYKFSSHYLNNITFYIQ